MIQTRNLSVTVDEKSILDTLSLTFEKGKNYCLLGKNGSGKSSFAMTLMWHPSYTVTKGNIFCDGEDITHMPVDQRAKKGIFLAFQAIPQLPWIKLFEFLRTIYSAKIEKQVSFVAFKKVIEPLLQELHIEKEFLWRDTNVGFSGWERRKVEILQMRLLEPTYIILDEVDSWLDVDAFRSVSALLQQTNTGENTFIIITHYFSILDYLPIDWVYVLEKGKLVAQGDKHIADEIYQNGFAEFSSSVSSDTLL